MYGNQQPFNTLPVMVNQFVQDILNQKVAAGQLDQMTAQKLHAHMQRTGTRDFCAQAEKMFTEGQPIDHNWLRTETVSFLEQCVPLVMGQQSFQPQPQTYAHQYQNTPQPGMGSMAMGYQTQPQGYGGYQHSGMQAFGQPATTGYQGMGGPAGGLCKPGLPQRPQQTAPTQEPVEEVPVENIEDDYVQTQPIHDSDSLPRTNGALEWTTESRSSCEAVKDIIEFARATTTMMFGSEQAAVDFFLQNFRPTVVEAYFAIYQYQRTSVIDIAHAEFAPALTDVKEYLQSTTNEPITQRLRGLDTKLKDYRRSIGDGLCALSKRNIDEALMSRRLFTPQRANNELRTKSVDQFTDLLIIDAAATEEEAIRTLAKAEGYTRTCDQILRSASSSLIHSLQICSPEDTGYVEAILAAAPDHLLDTNIDPDEDPEIMTIRQYVASGIEPKTIAETVAKQITIVHTVEHILITNIAPAPRSDIGRKCGAVLVNAPTCDFEDMVLEVMDKSMTLKVALVPYSIQPDMYLLGRTLNATTLAVSPVY